MNSAKRSSSAIFFSKCKKRQVEASFSGGHITSDAGILLLRQADKKIGLTKSLAAAINDQRDPLCIKHSAHSMVQQRVFGLALGYEDLNDHDTLRNDFAFQTATDRVEALASTSTLCRFEGNADRSSAVAASKLLVELFIRKHKTPPAELILDFDATDDLVHGKQEYGAFHGYYRHECFLPLYVTCGYDVLVSYLRPSNHDPAKHAWAILALLTQRLRQAWPQVRIIFRADSGFCRHRVFDWCERHNVEYIVGISGNSRLKELMKPSIKQAECLFESTQTKQRIFTEVHYQARTWSRARRIVGKAEHTSKGSNPRFIITNLQGDPQRLYDGYYCPRGDMENRIKEQQLELFADRTSAHLWWTNQLRLLLSTFAYCLLQTLRSTVLVDTELHRSQCATIRLKLLKLGAVVIRNTRRIRFLLCSSCPYQDLFNRVASGLRSPG